MSSGDDDRTGRMEKRAFLLNLVIQHILPQKCGKVEAALNENTCRVEHELRSIPAESELNTVPLSRKARMKDWFGNSIINTPLKGHKVISQETSVDLISSSCQSFFDNVIFKLFQQGHSCGY